MRYLFHVFYLFLFGLSACSQDDDRPIPLPIDEESVFAKGADVSWLTEMEQNGKLFYSKKGQPTDALVLLKSLGVNAIRLRVWVDPTDGWCNQKDVLTKALRAKALGLRLMIDFHYSDTWADPAHQEKPKDWKYFSFEELKNAVKDHTQTVLTLLKNNNIEVDWVQVGNETRGGMLWPDGQVSTENSPNFAQLINMGYAAVKAVYPEAKVIVHLDDGGNTALYTWFFDRLKTNGGKWDVIGLSLYPSWSSDSWSVLNAKCESNMNALVQRYGCKVMICEVGMPWDDPIGTKAFLSDLMIKARNVYGNGCLGLFYWEPEAYDNWKGYTLGAFDRSGRPTEALDTFSD